jgi:hypothetical protein
MITAERSYQQSGRWSARDSAQSSQKKKCLPHSGTLIQTRTSRWLDSTWFKQIHVHHYTILLSLPSFEVAGVLKIQGILCQKKKGFGPIGRAVPWLEQGLHECILVLLGHEIHVCIITPYCLFRPSFKVSGVLRFRKILCHKKRRWDLRKSSSLIRTRTSRLNVPKLHKNPGRITTPYCLPWARSRWVEC